MKTITPKRARNSIILCLLLLSGNLLAQQTKISGSIRDSKTSMALPGVNIVVKGTTIGTTTNVDGNYSISLKAENDTLLFSYVGFRSEERAAHGQSVINVDMVEEIAKVDEIVVIGYGVQKKSDLTGAVSVVKTENLNKIVGNDISKVLEGQASGVQIHGSGEPGAVARIQVRGIGSFQNTEPLYVIDGVPVGSYVKSSVGVGSYDQAGVTVGGIADFSPSDIESIQILKDASACAIYGARGSNGVIIITTKRGKAGKMHVSYEGNYGWQNIVKRMKMANREQFQQMNNIARRNEGVALAPANDSLSPYFINNINTDWQKEAFKTGNLTDHTLTFSGGSENAAYSISINYFDQTGTLKGPGPRYTRYSFRVNTDTKSGKFKFGESFYFSYSEQKKLSNSQWGNPIYDVLLAIPTVPVYDPNNLGGFGGANDTIQNMISPNEIAFNSIFTSWGKRYRFLGSVYGEYEFFSGLTYRINLDYDRSDWVNHVFTPLFFIGSRYVNTIAFLNEWRGENPYMLMEHTLTYQKEFGKHRLTLLGGYTAQYDFWAENYGHAEGYQQPYFEVLSAGTKNQAATGTKFEHSMISYLGRFNYSFADKYLVTASIRRDGSSRFGPNKKFGNFPSFALGWKINNEPFFKFDFINLLKLRAGYGVIGNEKIGDYQYDSYINQNASYVFNGKLPAAGIQTSLSDPSLHWEEKTTKNIGVDMAFLKNKIEFSAEYYYNDAHDLLIQMPVPYSTGVAITGTGAPKSPWTNAASMINKGLEFVVTYRKLEGEFHYEISANLTTLKNKVTKIGATNNPVTTYMSRTEVGHSMGELYGWVFEGIFQNQNEINNHAFQSAYTVPGDCKFADLDTNGVVDDADRKYLGSAFPTLTGGMNISMDYKGFDLSVFLQGVYGNTIWNGPYNLINGYKEGNYSLESYENYWRGEGTTNKYPRLTYLDPNTNNRTSARWFQDGSYLRVQNVQLGYTFSKSAFKFMPGVQSIRVYISAQNLFTLTKYTGFDPDITNDGLFYRGQDWGSYPNPRTFMIGAKLSIN